MNILRVDMSDLSTSLEPLPVEWKLIGGRGLTSRILSNEVPPELDPLHSSTKLVFACGPLAGTNAPSCGRLSTGAKSPLTGGIKESNSGGPIGQKMDRLGIRAVVIEGSCTKGKLFVLSICGKEISLLPADDYVGLKNTDLVSKLKDQFTPDASIISIGIGGERGYKSAAITMTDMFGKPTRHAARGGLGAVMANKGLKAILFDDQHLKGPEMAQKKLFQSIVKKWNREIRKDITLLEIAKYGTLGMIESLDHLGGVPTENYRNKPLNNVESLSGIEIKKLNEKRGGRMEACMAGCAVKCSMVYKDKMKKTVTANLQYQTVALMGTNLGLSDPDVIAKMNFLAGDLGLDTVEVGAAMGIAAEIGKMKMGNAESAFALIDEIEQGTKLGGVLANGVVATCEYFGIDRVPAFMGQALPAHDGRVSKAIGVTYATSPMGADHTAGFTYEKFNQKEGALERSMDAQIKAVMQDSCGYCQLATPSDPNLVTAFLSQLINARFDTEITPEQLLDIGQETLRIELEYNQGCHFSPVQNRGSEFLREETVGLQHSVFDVDEDKISAFWDELKKGNKAMPAAGLP